MAEDQDESQKTEDPTQKKLEDAKKKGDMPKSQEVTTWAGLAMSTLLIAALSGPMSEQLSVPLSTFLGQAHAFQLDGEASLQLFAELARVVTFAIAPLVLALMIAAIAGNMVQQAPILTTEKIKPKLKKINPLEGAKRLFGMQGLVNFAKGVAKLAIIGVIMALVIWPDRGHLLMLVQADPALLLGITKVMVLKIAGAAVVVLTLIAGLDYLYQRFDYQKRQRMTKQEVKDEFKQMEGDPHVKARLKQIRSERSRQRMIAAVPDATVVIANPTHFAVALKYEPGQQGAPLCVAKGVDKVALRIREVAEENNVPVMENPPLARTLHKALEIDEEVPPEHYKAVAEVIGFIMRMARRRRG